MNLPARFLLALLALFFFAISANAADPPEIRAGSELDFRPYCFTDKNGQPTGFGVELLRAVAEKASLHLRISPGEWDKVWKRLVDGEIDVLPVVARTPGREGLVEFTLPHTETFDAFFVREGQPPIKDLDAAAGKEIVVLRSDAAHHQLVERNFPGKVVPVDSIADGLRLIASGRHDALLCSRLIGVLERDQAGIKGVTDGPVIPDYKRVFSFAVHKGNTELVERLNQGLRLVQADGTYDRLYRKWLGVNMGPPPRWQTRFWQAIGILGVLVLIAVTWVVARKALEWDRRQPQALRPHPRGVRSAFWPYALAVLAMATSYAAHVGLEAWVGRGLPTVIMFYPAVMVAALLGGIGPGLLATAAAVIVNIWIMLPIGNWSIASPADRLALALFFIMGLFMAAVAELHRRNRAKAAAFDREEALRETRRESEERFRAVFESSSDCILVWDRQYNYLYANQAAIDHVGTTRDKVIGRNIRDGLGHIPDFMRLWMERVDRAFAMGEPFRVEDAVTVGDRLVYSESQISPIRDASGRVCAVSVVYRDTTTRKAAEEALRQLNETLEQRVAERTELAENRAMQLQALAMELTEAEERERQRVAQLLHDDLQQSLAAARMQLQSACECLSPDPVLANVEQILGESLQKTRRLSHELSPAVLHHSGLVASLEWLTRQMKEQFGLQVQLESDGAQQFESAPLKVFLFRAVQELLFNVVKHAGVKTARVALSSSDGSLAVSVSDPGQGFDPGILDSITTLGGFGLLSLRERARYIGGDLTVESAAGKGSRFTLMVPISLAKAEKMDHPAMGLQPPAPAEALIPAGAGGIRVLFVDDHHVMRQGLIRLMNGQPVVQVVGEAANGQEAIEQVRQLRPDVVVMDVSMPEMDGIEATRRIKAEWPEVRVIGLSMHDDEHISQAMRAAGAEAFMSKTASPAELLKAIYETAPIRTSLPLTKW
jgi:PAS domain S-box-containing protein